MHSLLVAAQMTSSNLRHFVHSKKCELISFIGTWNSLRFLVLFGTRGTKNQRWIYKLFSKIATSGHLRQPTIGFRLQSDLMGHDPLASLNLLSYWCSGIDSSSLILHYAVCTGCALSYVTCANTLFLSRLTRPPAVAQSLYYLTKWPVVAHDLSINIFFFN